MSTTIPTAPLSPAAVEAMRSLELRLASPLMQFPTEVGETVSVYAVGSESAPYSWTCSAGHSAAHAYASLPFCRDDAREHAGSCEVTAEMIAAGYATAEVRANELIQAAQETGSMSDLNADDLAHYIDLMAGCRCQLKQAGRLDLVGGVS